MGAHLLPEGRGDRAPPSGGCARAARRTRRRRGRRTGRCARPPRRPAPGPRRRGAGPSPVRAGPRPWWASGRGGRAARGCPQASVRLLRTCGPCEPVNLPLARMSESRSDPSARDSLGRVAAEVAACRACPRLVEWREQVATEKVARFRDWDYWARGVPGFGDPDAHLVVVGLAPAAHGANRTGRVFTGDRSGDFLYAALHRSGYANQPTSVSVDDGLAPHRRVDHGGRAVRAAGQQADAGRARHVPAVPRARAGVAPDGPGAARPRPVRLGRGVLDLRPAPPAAVRPRRRGRAARTAGVLLGSYHVSQQNTFTGKLTEPMLDAVLARARLATLRSTQGWPELGAAVDHGREGRGSRRRGGGGAGRRRRWPGGRRSGRRG